MSVRNGTATSPVAEPETAKAPPLYHFLHHFEGTTAVAYCGYRKENPTLGTDMAECVVCVELWKAGTE